MNVNKLKGTLVEKGMNVSTLAERLEINRSSLYRKLNNNGDTLTIKEANRIVAILDLSEKEASDIFFSQVVA